MAGEIAAVSVEKEKDERKIDHVWISIHAGEVGRLQVALSTCSRQNRAAGFDARVRLGSISSAWSELPPAGLRKVDPLDYAVLETAHAVEYVPYERTTLEELLVAKARRAIYVEAWGDCYIRAHIGVHQIHSRRASFAVLHDLVGRDGAVQFYFQDKMRELLLFKFAGQP